MALLVIALSWLGWLLLDQDLSLKEQRIRERIDTAAVELERAVANGIVAKQENLNEIAAILNTLPGSALHTLGDVLRKHTTYIHFSTDGMTVMPETGLRYLSVPREAESLQVTFEQADRLEFQHQDYSAAILLLKPLAASPDANLQAAALMRLGRIARRSGHISEALNSYQVLVGLSGQKVGSVPADWLGLYARCVIYEAENKMLELGVELDHLVLALTAGGRQVSEQTYRFYVDSATRWAGIVGMTVASQKLAQAHAPSAMADEFFRTWGDWRQGASASSGIQIGGTSPELMLGIWTTIESDLLAGIFAFDVFHRSSLAAVTDQLESQGIGWRISDATGQILLSSGPIPGGKPPSLRSLAIGGMAFTVTTFATPAMIPDTTDIKRRRLLFAGLFLILAIIIASTYFISRSLRREAEIARLQSDFVAAVSHEFRTPLTSIRQLSEMLASGRVRDKEKVNAYYHILEKETARLQRLVEGLLDFGRMEANVHPYRPETLNCRTLLSEIATTFREEYDLTTEALSLEIKEVPDIWMDKEALTRAIWNLLDNAVKYSPEAPEIKLSVQLKSNQVNIAVADNGVGIPPDERSDIFSKFVRGSAADLTNAKGTGMGLAMVRKIIEDQGGSISVRGNQGGGSVFTIVLALTD